MGEYAIPEEVFSLGRDLTLIKTAASLLEGTDHQNLSHEVELGFRHKRVTLFALKTMQRVLEQKIKEYLIS